MNNALHTYRSYWSKAGAYYTLHTQDNNCTLTKCAPERRSSGCWLRMVWPAESTYRSIYEVLHCLLQYSTMTITFKSLPQIDRVLFDWTSFSGGWVYVSSPRSWWETPILIMPNTGGGMVPKPGYCTWSDLTRPDQGQNKPLLDFMVSNKRAVVGC